MLFLLIYMFTGFAFPEAAEEIKLPEFVKSWNNKDVIGIAGYADYLEKYKDLEMAYGVIRGLENLKNFIEARNKLVLNASGKGKEAGLNEVFGDKFLVVSADLVLLDAKYQKTKPTEKYARETISDFIVNSGLKDYEEGLNRDKKVDIASAINFYKGLLEKLGMEIEKGKEAFKKGIAEYEAAFENLKVQSCEFEIYSLSSSGNVASQFEKGASIKLALKYSTLNLADKEINFNWKILFKGKILKEGKTDIPCGKEDKIDIINLTFTPDFSCGEYSLVADFNYKGSTRTLKPYYFYLINPDLDVIKIYTTDLPEGTKEVKKFRAKEKIVLVVLHEIGIDTLPSDKKKVEFLVYDPKGNIVPELSSSKEFKAVKGKRISRLIKDIPRDIVSGEYTFEGRVTLKDLLAARRINFIIEACPVKINGAYVSSSLDSDEALDKVELDKSIYLKVIHSIGKSDYQKKKVTWSILDASGKKIFVKTKEYPASPGTYSLYHVISFTPQSPSGKYVFVAEISIGPFSEKKSYDFELGQDFDE